jgi:predicted transcriptional regulator
LKNNEGSIGMSISQDVNGFVDLSKLSIDQIKVLEESGLLTPEESKALQRQNLLQNLEQIQNKFSSSLGLVKVKMEDLWRVDPKLALDVT